MKSYKEDFPLLRNSSIAYLDNAATAQRPEAVLKAEREFYEKYNANPLRGLYQLGMDATDCYEKARETVRDFLHAKKSSEIIFTRNTTESINLVAYSYALNNLKEGDELLVGIDSHHSNLLPWQMAARVTGAKLVFLDCEMDGSYTKEAIEKVITERTKFAAITHVSNVIGRVNPVEEIIRLVHKNGGVVLVDAAQSAPHLPVDVCAMDVDFLAFSGHKLMAPMGIGVLYGKEKLLDEEIRHAAEIACVDESILHFTDGYDTIVGERGVTLSGGQKQRVAIARMLMKEAPILVFDDSLSAVDTETDNKIRKELKKEMEKATVIMISHRITSLMQADCIIVMDKGEIQQMGTHEELIHQEGPYKDIYEIQMNSDIRLMEGGAACE